MAFNNQSGSLPASVKLRFGVSAAKRFGKAVYNSIPKIEREYVELSV